MTASSSVRRGTRQRYVPAWVYPLWVQTASHPCRCACCHPTCIPCRRKSLVYSFVNAVDLFEPRQCFRVIHPRLIKCFFTVDVVAVIKIIQFVVSHCGSPWFWDWISPGLLTPSFSKPGLWVVQIMTRREGRQSPSVRPHKASGHPP